MGRSGSSSMASIESPSQSRTSSFGVSGAILLRSAVEQVMNRAEKNVERLRHEANNEVTLCFVITFFLIVECVIVI